MLTEQSSISSNQVLVQEDDEKLIFEVLVDSFKAELNKILYSNSSANLVNSKRILASIRKKHLFSILFQSTFNSQLNEEIIVRDCFNVWNLRSFINFYLRKNDIVEEFNEDFSRSISNATVLLSKLCAEVIDSSHKCISYLEELREKKESTKQKQQQEQQNCIGGCVHLDLEEEENSDQNRFLSFSTSYSSSSSSFANFFSSSLSTTNHNIKGKPFRFGFNNLLIRYTWPL